MLPYLLVTFGALATVAADLVSKLWSANRAWSYFVLACALYLIASLAFMFSLTMGKMTVLNAFWSVSVFVAVTALGALYFHESVSLLQKFALVFGFASIALFVSSEVFAK